MPPAKPQVILYNNNLVATDLTDTMEALSAMPSLAWVDLSGNDFNGASLPATIPTGLKLLRLRNSQLAGSIPSELGAWSTLEHFDVSKNSISAVSVSDVYSQYKNTLANSEMYMITAGSVMV